MLRGDLFGIVSRLAPDVWPLLNYPSGEVSEV